MNSQIITIQEQQFSVPAPYAAGHVINDGEAHALNQTRAENIRNNFGAMMKKAKEKGQALSQADLDAYVAEYEFGTRSGGVRVDPVTTECRRLARAAINAALQKKGIKVKDVPKEHMEKLVSDAAPKFRAKAEAIVADRQAAVSAVADLDISVG